jgi:hypothetical protein
MIFMLKTELHREHPDVILLRTSIIHVRKQGRGVALIFLILE